MAGSHVPKFGNWDGENVPYTAYFENARKSNNKGGKMINPNDPEENPEAFAYCGDEDASINISPTKTPFVEKHQYQQSTGPTNSNSESFGDSDQRQSISGFSVNQPTRRRRTSDVKKNKNDRGNGFVPPSPNRLMKNSRNPSEDLSCSSAASVPKFGAWDEKDPKSGEGFTVIFNKVKEEKHIAAAKFPIVQPQSNMSSSNNNKKNAKSKSYSASTRLKLMRRMYKVSVKRHEIVTHLNMNNVMDNGQDSDPRVPFMIKELNWLHIV